MMTNEVRKMVEALYETIRAEVIEVMAANLRGAAVSLRDSAAQVAPPPRASRVERAPAARTSRPSKLSKKPKKPAKRQTDAVNGALAARMVDLIQKSPGIRQDAIATALGVEKGSMRYTIQALVRAKKIRLEGKTRAATYYPA